MIVPWYATGFRADGFEEALGEVAAVALRYGASSYAVYRSKDDRYRFQQFAHFAKHIDWERYWDGPEMTDFRVRYSRLVPDTGALRMVGPHRRRRHRGRAGDADRAQRPSRATAQRAFGRCARRQPSDAPTPITSELAPRAMSPRSTDGPDARWVARALALAARHPPLWARWLLTILAFAVLILAGRGFVPRQRRRLRPDEVRTQAEVQANREGNIVVEEDQAPHTARCRAGVARQLALEDAIAGGRARRVQNGELTGHFRACAAQRRVPRAPVVRRFAARSARPTSPTGSWRCSTQPTRQFTWCKMDPPPASGATEVPLSARCRV